MAALDIASGMAYLHSQGILHGDLSASNILLSSSADDARGYTIKIADYGLTGLLSGIAMKTGTYGAHLSCIEQVREAGSCKIHQICEGVISVLKVVATSGIAMLMQSCMAYEDIVYSGCAESCICGTA